MHFAIYQLRRLGWPGIAGVCLLAITGGLLMLVLIPAINNYHVLEHSVVAITAEAKAGKIKKIAASPRSSLKSFYGMLPPEQAVVALTDKIFTIALQNNIEPDKGVYLLKREPGTRLSRYEISLPVSGKYTDIRLYIVQVLNALPTAAMDAISFNRPAGNEGRVNAQLHFTIYLGRSA